MSFVNVTKKLKFELSVTQFKSDPFYLVFLKQTGREMIQHEAVL